MRNNINFENARLIEALDYIDRDLIAEVIDDIKAPDMSAEPAHDHKITRRSIRYALTLAASLILISAIIPAVTYIIQHFDLFPAGISSGTTEESSGDPDVTVALHEENAPYPIFTPDLEPISAEMIEEIKDAWYRLVYDAEYKEISERNTYDDKKQIEATAKAYANSYTSYFFSERMQDHFYARYYGTVNSCIIFAMNSRLEGENNIITIGSTSIENDYSFYLFAYRDGVIETLENAYASGWLTDENIEKVKERHNKFVASGCWIVNPKYTYHYAKFTPDLEEISDEMIEEMSASIFEQEYKKQLDALEYVKDYYKDRKDKERAANEAYTAAKNASIVFMKTPTESMDSFERSFRYYGRFGDNIIWAEVSDLNSVTQLTLNGYYFFYSNYTSLYVYTNGEFMELTAAYNKGLLSDGDIINLYYRYCLYNIHIQEANREPAEDTSTEFSVTPEQDAILSDIFGHYYAATSGNWGEWMNKCFSKEEADIWNSAAPSDILSVLDFLSEDSRFYKLWRKAPSDSSFSKMYYISITPEQDAIITELVDEKYRHYAGFWDIWFYKILDTKRINEWNSSHPSSYDEIKKYMEDNRIVVNIESGVPLYSE